VEEERPYLLSKMLRRALGPQLPCAANCRGSSSDADASCHRYILYWNSYAAIDASTGSCTGSMLAS
jgi:hypothetical protein